MSHERTTPRACEQCGQGFLADPGEIRRGGGRFCSRKCGNGYNRASKSFALTCAECGKGFTVTKASDAARRRFCSRHCMGRARHVPPAERFWSKVNKDGPIPSFRPDLGPCWIWLASYYQEGYGQFFRRHGQPTHAHIVAYELVIGPAPDGLDLDHLCRVRACVNPYHLEPVTGQENRRRGLGGVLRTHCPQDHPYDVENTRIEKNGARSCRECSRLRCSPGTVRQRPVILKPRNR